MKDSERTINNHCSLTKTCMGIMLLLIGCLVYLLFRSKTLHIYVWCESLGLSAPIDALRIAVQNWPIPVFVKFSLPDGLYCASYLLIIDGIWHNEKRWKKYLFLAAVPVITVSSELLQFFGLAKGTFDMLDLICYLFPPLIYIVINTKIFTKLKIK